MEPVRPFTKHDIPEVLALYRAAFSSEQQTVVGDPEAYFHRVFFQSPWADDDLPSLVYLNPRGEIVGFIGVQPRRMSLHGRTLRAAVCTKFMVRPDSRGERIALRLLKEVFGRPQDIVISDLANDPVRRLWEGLGGKTALLYSLSWSRVLRPARHVVSWGARRRVLKLVAAAARPFCALGDALAARSPFNRFDPRTPGYTTDELGPETLVTRLPQLCSPQILRPSYEGPSAQWLLELASATQGQRTFRRRSVRNPAGEVVGWFLYLFEPSGASEVIQMAAQKDSAGVVLDCLLADAWRVGSVKLSGRLDPRFLQALSARRCRLDLGSWVLIHSRLPDVVTAVLSGDAFISRFEGEL